MKKFPVTLLMALVFLISTLSYSAFVPDSSLVDVVSAATYSEPEPEPEPTPEPIPNPTPEPEPTPISTTNSSDEDSLPGLSGYSSWAEDELAEAYTLGLIPESLTQNLSSPITRLEFATLAVHFYEQLKDTSVPYESTSPFVDTSDTAVLKAYALGITSGQGNQLFNPEGLVSRQEMATFVYRTLNAIYGDFTQIMEDPDYDDFEDIADWALAAIRFTHAYSIISGTDTSHFSPLMTATDEMAVLLLYRSLSHSDDYELEDLDDMYDDDPYDYDDDHDRDDDHDDDDDHDTDDDHDDDDDHDTDDDHDNDDDHDRDDHDDDDHDD